MERIETTVSEGSDGERLDRFLARFRPDISRSAIQREIRDGLVRISGDVVRRTAHRLHPGESIVWHHTEPAPLTPTRIPLSILFEDDSLIAIDKPAGLVVHPGAGTEETTLVEGLLASRDLPESDEATRPGIVHRLDKGTSGVIVVAKTASALASLQAQFADRTTAKSYLAVVEGRIEEETGTIDAPIGRDPTRPSRMAVDPRGRPSVTEFDVLVRNDDRTLLHVRPHTGRTHQIRTHLLYIGHPIVGDEIYGPGGPRDRRFASPFDPGSRESSDPTRLAQRRSARVENCSRLLLHAWRLVIRHPETEEVLRFEAPPPDVFPPYEYRSIPWRQIPDAS